jgi:hypothetical protein
MRQPEPAGEDRSRSGSIPLPVGDHRTHRPAAGQGDLRIVYARNGCLRESACFAKTWHNRDAKASVLDSHGFSNIETNRC